MKVYKIKAKKEEQSGLYTLPTNISNRMMFSYPYYTTSDYDTMMIKKINAIVTMYGERYESINIGMMGIDNILIWSYSDTSGTDTVENNIMFGDFKLVGDYLFEFNYHDIESGKITLLIERYFKIINLKKVMNGENKIIEEISW